MNKIQKILIVFSLATILVFMSAAWHYQKKLSLDAQLRLQEHFYLILSTTHLAVTSWANERKLETQRWAEDDLLLQTTKKLLYLDPSNLASNPAQITLRHWLRPIIHKHGYLGYFIIGPNQLNLASSRIQNIGDKNLLSEQKLFFEKIWSGETAISLPLKSDVDLIDNDGRKKKNLPTMFVGAPIFNEAQEVIAVFTFRINPLNKFSDLFKLKDPRKSEKKYAFDRSGILLSDSIRDTKQERDSSSSESILNLTVRNPKLQKNTFEMFLDYVNYQGVPVIGSSLWDDGLNMGIAVELNKNEAFKALEKEKNHVIFAAILLILVTIFGGALTLFYLLSAQQKQLKESEERAKTVMNTVIEGVIIYDISGIIKSANYAAESIFEYNNIELIGANIRKLISVAHLAEKERINPLYNPLLNLCNPQSKGSRRELIGQKQDDTLLPVEWTIALTENHSSHLFTAIIRDLTDQKHKERKSLIKDAALESALNAILVIDNQAAITYVNPSMLNHWKLSSRDEIIGQSTSILLKDKSKTEQIHIAVTQHGSWTGELEAVRKDGSCFYIRLSASAIKDSSNNIVSLMGICEDITEQKRAEEKMLKAKESAEKANQSKTEFLTKISHELRTPLNAVIGFSRLFELDNTLTEDQHLQANEITKAGEHLVNLINDLLDLAKIEAGKMSLSNEMLNLNNLLNECESLIRPSLSTNNLKLTLDIEKCGDCCIYADPIRLKQVLLNILSNAVKYNSINGSINIHCEQVSKTCVRISIADTGKGIVADNQHKIFDRFDRLGAEQSKIEGSGIGLMISKQIIEMMNGRLGFESKPGEGSTFWIEIAYNAKFNCKESQNALARPVEKESPYTDEISIPRHANILVAEDNAVNQLVIRKQLKRVGYDNVTFSINGVEALSLWQRKPYDILLTDINMPEMDGYELAKNIREQERTTDNALTIVAITANAGNIEKDFCLATGMNFFISKPVDIDILKKLLDDWEYNNSKLRR